MQKTSPWCVPVHDAVQVDDQVAVDDNHDVNFEHLPVLEHNAHSADIDLVSLAPSRYLCRSTEAVMPE